MARRFSRLDWAAKNGMTGTVITKYQAFKSGTANITVDRSGSKPGEFVLTYLNPFGVPASETYVVGYSKRAADQKATVFTNASVLNQQDAPSDGSDITEGKYTPAKATVTTKGTAETPTPSQITGISYNKVSATSYTFPFGGKGTANETRLYVPVCRAIEADVNLKVRQSVSFTPEKF